MALKHDAIHSSRVGQSQSSNIFGILHFHSLHSFHSIPCHPIPLHFIPFTPFHSIPLYAIPCHSNSILSHPTLLHSFHSIPFHSTPFHLIPLCGSPCHSISIPCHAIPLHSIPFHPFPFHFILLCFSPFHFTTLYFSPFYSTVQLNYPQLVSKEEVVTATEIKIIRSFSQEGLRLTKLHLIGRLTEPKANLVFITYLNL